MRTSGNDAYVVGNIEALSKYCEFEVGNDDDVMYLACLYDMGFGIDVFNKVARVMCETTVILRGVPFGFVKMQALDGSMAQVLCL